MGMGKFGMSQNMAEGLRLRVEREAPMLLALSEERSAASSRPGGWTPRQELGHLIDSATNNHVRFVAGSLQGSYVGPAYDQNGWVALHGYGELPWPSLIEFWRQYNLLLARVIERIPDEKLEASCTIGGAAPVTLRFVIEDYILHMQHHIDQLLQRERVTAYPGAAAGV